MPTALLFCKENNYEKTPAIIIAIIGISDDFHESIISCRNLCENMDEIWNWKKGREHYYAPREMKEEKGRIRNGKGEMRKDGCDGGGVGGRGTNKRITKENMKNNGRK